MSGVRRWILNWLLVLIVFALVDAGWIMGVVMPIYRRELGDVMAASVDSGSALAFYLLFCAGLTYFGLAPQKQGVPVKQRIINSALYGLFTYATWALTLKVVLGKVSWALVLGDILWGIALCGVVSGITILISYQLGKLSQRKALNHEKD